MDALAPVVAELRRDQHEIVEQPRAGDHRWWISDVAPFERDYPGWGVTVGIREILEEIHAVNAEAWLAPAVH